ncbi:DUF1772 domain-containing protein [bacterium]|nr:DUF1772 domain-containing protein [bacterium]
MAVLGFSIWVGGTLFNMLVIVPLWSVSAESLQSFLKETDFERTIFHFFGPPWMAVRVVPIFSALAAAWPFRFHRLHLLVSALCMTSGIIYTIVYIYPINEVLFFQAGGSHSPEEIKAMADQWVFADRLRFSVLVIGYISLLRAFSKPLPKEPTV